VIENTDENIDIGYVETPIYDITEDDLSSVEEELLSVYDKDVNIDIPVVIKLDNNAEQDHVEAYHTEEEEDTEEEEEHIENEHTEEEHIEDDHTKEHIEDEPLPILSIKEKDESYKRLNVNQLKAVVISKGITTDTTKMKKNDLIKLLENFE
jgi:hypothetical protein